MALPRAVIYCRCSTEEESQTDALRKQVAESENCVREQGWLLSDRYVELKSGTTTRGRDEYNRLFEELLSDKFDIIVIKSQDRLMRNVKDWYLFLDRMLSHGKRLFMYIEQKFYTADDALITGIKAILAEEYSRELSKKINNAHRSRQKNGGKAMLTSRTFGFLKRADGSVEVIEEEAEVIRRIYAYSAAGYGSRAISNMFLEQGYVKRTGNPLTAACVARIIRNPLYKGTMIMNRRHYDFETKKTVKIPKEQWIYRDKAAPAIVDGDLWEQANQAMTDRAARFHRDETFQKGSRTGQYALSGKIICCQCGKPYYRTWRHRYADMEHPVIEWKCSTYLQKGRSDAAGRANIRKEDPDFTRGCDNIHLNENTVLDLLSQISGGYCDIKGLDKERIAGHTVRILRDILGGIPARQTYGKAQKEEKRLEAQKDFLLTKLLDGVISDRDYRKKNDALEKELARLRARKDGLRQHEWKSRSPEHRIEAIKNRLENGGFEKAAAAAMLDDIREIRVHEWQLELCFDPLRIRGLSTDNGELTGGMGERMPGDFTLWCNYPFAPETVRGRYLDRRRIMELLRHTPSMTAGKLAEQMGRSAYMVRNRMEELTKGGYIRFNGRGGRGTWEILRELPDKEESIRAGGL